MQTIRIPPIELQWSQWYLWNDLKEDARSGGIRIPNKTPGVYDVRLINSPKRLTIGKASDLRMRIRQGLIKGKTPHSAGKQIRDKEDVNGIEIRWAVTERPSAVEEELHKSYVLMFGEMPKHTDHT